MASPSRSEYPPLGKSYVISYAGSDVHYPVIGIKRDPRTDGYKVPADLSPHPDKERYPNHIFTGSQPTGTDERVLWVYEILPSIWIPFARYDDDLGAVKGRRRAVKNLEQPATLTASSRTVYEAREGSATVSIETEESWDASVDDDGNSKFPIKCREIYDPLRGNVRECRQLFPITGQEVATLNNENGVITQTTYEIYNQYLNFKVIQTYTVSGPQLVGSATDNSGLVATITTQRKASDGYVAPPPSATRTVEANREDAETVVERTTDLPKVFNQRVIEVQKPDTIPSKFRTAKESTSTSITEAGDDVAMDITLSDEQYSRAEQRLSEFIKKTTITTKDNSSFPVLNGLDYEEQFNIQIPYTESIVTSLPGSGTYEADPLGNGRWLLRSFDTAEIESILDSVMVTFPTRHSLDLPPVLKEIRLTWDTSESIGEQVNDATLTVVMGLSGATQEDSGQNSAQISATPQFDVIMKDVWAKNLMATSHIFFLRGPVSENDILTKLNAQAWPVFKPQSYALTTTAVTASCSVNGGIRRQLIGQDGYVGGIEYSKSKTFHQDRAVKGITLSIPPCIHEQINVVDSRTVTASPSVALHYDELSPIHLMPGVDVKALAVDLTYSGVISETSRVNFNLPPTTPSSIPSSGLYVVDSSVDFYKYGYFICKAIVIDAAQLA